MLKISTCLVVCLPLAVLLLISPVSISFLPVIWFIIVDFPTPDGPASATLAPFIKSYSLSMPSPFLPLIITTGKAFS